MRFDLSETQTLFAAALERGLDGLDESDPDKTDARLFSLGVGETLATLDEAEGGPPSLLLMALCAEAVGRRLGPWTALRGGLGAWLLRRSASNPAITALADGLASGRDSVVFALGDQPVRLVEGHAGNAHLLWQAGGKLMLYAPGSAVICEQDRADRSRPAFEVQAPDGPPIAELGDVAPVLDALRILRAADSFGAASVAFEMTCEYVKVRRQFDRPIGSFQAVRHQLADLAQDIYPCRYLIWRAASLWGKADSEREATLTKAHVCDVAVGVTRATVELHGAIGFTEEYPLHRYVKRAAENRSRDGLSPALRERIAQLGNW